MAWWDESPAATEIEISVFGRGVGECVVVHVGGGQWVVIDSYELQLNRRSCTPVALQYLSRFPDFRPESNVSSVVLTHLHSDHFVGIDTLAARCVAARLYLPGVSHLGDRAEQALLAIAKSERSGERLVGIEKVVHAWRRVKARHPPGNLALPAHGPGTLIVVGAGAACSITAISPLGGLFEHVLDDDHLAPTQHVQLTGTNANLTSIVLWLQAGAHGALLSADMDDSKLWGWGALLTDREGQKSPAGIGFVKVPHHGSVNPEFLSVMDAWSESPIAVVTTNGRRLPDPDHWSEIVTRSNVALVLGNSTPRLAYTGARVASTSDCSITRVDVAAGADTWRTVAFKDFFNARDIAFESS